MRTNESDRQVVRMIEDEARVFGATDERGGATHRRTAHAIYRRTPAVGHAHGDRPVAETRRESAPGWVEAALTGFESDLSCLEELPKDRIDPSGGELDRMERRLKRLIASLKDPRP